MSLIFFDDSVSAGALPATLKYGVFYVDGRFANYAAVRARLPHAALFGITVFGKTGKGIFACDCETGDLTVAQAVAWVEAQIKLGVELICVYANQDRWLDQGLLKALAKYGKRIKRWVADYDDVKTVPSWADAHQFLSTNVPNLDYDVALANFFQGATPAASAPKPVAKPAAAPVVKPVVVPDPNTSAPVRLPAVQVTTFPQKAKAKVNAYAAWLKQHMFRFGGFRP